MNISKTVLAGIIGSVVLFSGCTEKSTNELNDSVVESTPRSDLTTQTIIDKDGNEKIVQSSQTHSIKGKTATIRTNQQFTKIEDATLTIEKAITHASQLVKNSTITIENGAVFTSPYIKNSKIIVKKGGDLQVTERLKGTEVLLEGGTFSVKPSDIDEVSKITEK